MKHLRLGTAAVALVLALIPAISHAFEAGFARISMIDGEALVRTEESSEWLPAAVNTPLYEGDSVWSPDGGRVEIQMQNGSYLRLNDSTSIDIVALARDYQQVHLGMGHVYVRSGRIGANGLQIDVDDTSLKVYDKARFRVDLAENGDEEISLFKGEAQVEGTDGRTFLHTGELLAVEEGRSELAPLNPPDEWERWNRDRDRRLAERKNGGRYLPEELAVYANDLDANGEWINVPEYGHVWRPTVIFSAEWSPYREGRWVWRGGDYIWVSSESWGWAPYHYGRWVVLPDRGWCWVPPARADVFWSPGYVGWVTTPTHVGWVPLAPGEIYYGRGNYGRNSVNITTVNITQTRVTNVAYINASRNVTNAVTVVPRDAFASGRTAPVKGRENILAQKNVVFGRPSVRPLAREALMPVVKPVSTAKLPPARLVSVPVRELRERHPQLVDRLATPPLRGEKVRRGPEQARPEKGWGSDRLKSAEKAGAAPPAAGGTVRENGRPVPPPRPAVLPAVREAEQHDGKNGRPAPPRPAPQPGGEVRPAARPDQARVPGAQSGEAKLKPQGEGAAKKIRKVKEKDEGNENKDKPKTKID